MATKTLRVAVHGATGVQGKPVAEAFLQAGFTTRVLTRDATKASALAERGAQVIEADLNDLNSLQVAYADVDVLALLIPYFVVPPANPIAYMQNVVEAAKTAKIKHIIWNTGGHLFNNLVDRPMIDMRYHMFNLIKDSGIPYTVFAPLIYMQNLAGPWTVSEISDNDVLAYPMRPTDKIGWIDVADIANFVVSAAQTPDATNQIYRINGKEALTGEEMAIAFSKALDRSIRFEELTPQEFGNRVAGIFGEQAGKALADDYAYIQSHSDMMLPFHDMKTLTEKFSVNLTSLQDWVRQHAPMFSAKQTTTS